MRRARLFVLLLSILVLFGCGVIPTRQAGLPTPAPYTIRQRSPTPIPPTATATPTASPTSTATPSPVPLAVELTVDPLQVIAGHTLLIRLDSNLPITASGFLDESELLLFPEEEGRRHTALVGVSVWASAGPRTVSILSLDSLGRNIVLSRTVEVLSGEYPVEYIHLLPGRSALLAPEIVQEEWAHIEPILSAVSPERLWEGGFITPSHGYVSSPFGGLRSYDGEPPSSYHSGLDISNVTGTLVIASQRGEVVLAERLQVRGGTIILDHGWGVHSAYVHLSEILVQVGEMVEQEQEIGRIGATGLVTGAHLHWEIRLGLTPVDPQEWVRRGDFLLNTHE